MIICVFLPIGEILPAKTKSCLQVVCVFAHYWWAQPIQAGTVKNCLQVVSKSQAEAGAGLLMCSIFSITKRLGSLLSLLVIPKPNFWLMWIAACENEFHSSCLWFDVVFALPHLVVVPHVGDDVVHVPLLRLLQHPLHQLLGHSLPGEHVHNTESRCWGWAEHDHPVEWGHDLGVEGVRM